MSNLFYGYDLRDYTKKEILNIDAILARHAEKYGVPPSILINKNDSESIPTSLGAEVDKYVLPHSILLEIPEDFQDSLGNIHKVFPVLEKYAPLEEENGN